MFKFLKNKIKDAVDRFKKTAEEEVEEVKEEELTLEEEQQLKQEETQDPTQKPIDETATEPEIEEVPEEKPEDVEESKIEEPEPGFELEPRPDSPQPVSEPAEEIKEELEVKVEVQEESEPEPKWQPDSPQSVESAPQPEPELDLLPDSQPSVSSPEPVKEEKLTPRPDSSQPVSEPRPIPRPKPTLPDESSTPQEKPVEPASQPIEEDVQEFDQQESDEDGEDLAEEYHAPKKGFFGRLFRKAKEEVEEVEENIAEKELESGDFKEPAKPKLQKEELQEEPKLDQEPKVEESAPKPKVEPEPVVEEPQEDLHPDSPSSVSSPRLDSNVPVSSPLPDEQPAGKAAVHKDLLEEDVKDATQKKKGFLSKLKERVVRFKLTEEKFEEVFWDFELALMENNVAVEVIEKIKKDMHDKLTQENVSRKSVEQVILDTLKDSIADVLDVESFDLLEKIKSRQADNQNTDSDKRPFVIAMVGVNGSGKTTALAKLIKLFQKNNLSMVVAAADTFRAAAIQQLEEHTTKLGVKLIKHDYNADPAAVAFDAVKHATAKNLDVVLIDTAGRLQSNSNLMDELKKLVRVNKPDLNIFVGESITGNDCVEQAVAFNEAVGIDGVILTKADVDEKGGAALSVSYVTKKPILFIGTGQTYEDLKPFSKEEVLANLGL